MGFRNDTRDSVARQYDLTSEFDKRTAELLVQLS